MDSRDVFPLERLGALEAGQLALNARMDMAMELIDKLGEDMREGRRDSRRDNERTRAWIGSKLDKVVDEAALVRAEAEATRGDLRGLKRFIAGAVATITMGTPLVLWLIERAGGSGAG